VHFDRPDRPLTLARFRQAASRQGIRLSRKTRMLHRGKHLFINGESFVMRREDKPSLVLLANERRLDNSAVANASEDVMEALHAWYEDGWVNLE
jgi:50S ribosomal protein L16 3-hydroxylase